MTEKQEQSIQLYEGSSITFDNMDGKLMVNATQMAGHFGKKPYDWLATKQSKEYISEFASISGIPEDDLVRVQSGSPENGGGTWMQEDIALCFAQWLSPKFYIWCNQRIKELLKTGHTEMSHKTKRELYLALAAQEEEIERLAVVAREAESERDAVREVLDTITDNELTFSEVAKLACKSGIHVGRNELFSFARKRGYLMKRHNEPYQHHLDKFTFKMVKGYNNRLMPQTKIKKTFVETFIRELLNEKAKKFSKCLF